MSYLKLFRVRIAFLVLAAGASAIPATAQSEFYPVTPCRIYNTVGGDGLRNMWDPNNPDPQHKVDTTYTIPVLEPAVTCGVPADAVAVAITVTIFGASKDGYLQVFPAGTVPPAPSPDLPPGAFEFDPGKSETSFQELALGTGGALSFLATMETSPPPTGTYHIAFDVFGYYSNRAPVVTTTPGTTAFIENGGAVVVDSGVVVTDADDTDLASATVAIINPLDGAAEVISATNCAGLTLTPGLNSLSISGNQPLATYQTCFQSVTYNNTSDTPDVTKLRDVVFIADDGTTSSFGAIKKVSVAEANDAPVVTTTAGTTAFAEDGGPVVVDSGVTVTDSDNANLASATVTITNALDGTDETLAATSCAGLTVTPGNPLTISGSQPLATYQACLQSVTYDNTSQAPDPTSRVIEFVANDGTASSAAASKTVTVGGGADAPVVTTTPGTTAFTEGAAVVVDAGVTVTDPDDTNLESATVSLASAPDGASEVLSATSCAGLTVTPGNPLTITGSQPLATYQTCLQSVTYNNTSQNPTAGNRTVNFVANDGDGNSNTASKTVSVAAVNDAPVVTTTAGTTAFTENAGAVVVDAGVTVTDADDVNLESATVSLASAPDGASEVLSATSCAGLTVTPGNPLTITGSQPVATYQTCLQSVTYNNTSETPDGTNRTVNFVVNDGDNNSNTASKTVSVTAVNDLPVVTTTAGTTAFTEDAGAVVVDAGVTVTDADDANLESATVSLASAPNGGAEVLSATSCAGLTVTPGNPLTITGSQPVATYQACLQSVTYNNTSQSPNTANRTVNFVVNDGDNNSNTASKTVSVTAVNDLPVVTTTAGTTAFTEDAGAVVVDNGLTVTDADDANLESATVSLASAPDGASEVLSATSCAGLTVTPGNPLTITGSQSVAAYQTCLRSVTYNNTSQSPNAANRTVNFVVNDGDNNSNTASKTVSVTAANDLPVVTTTAGITAFTEDAGAVVVDNGLTVTDADDTNLESATVSLASAPDGASEVLSATSCAGLTVTPGNPLTITGSQSVAAYQTCLRSVTYNNSSQNPNGTNRTVNFVVNDGDNNSNTASKTVSVTAVNDLPVVTTTAGTTAFTEDAGAVVVDNGLTVTDADDANLESATVSLASAPDGASEVLSATSCAGLTVTPGNPLTITGSQSVAAYQTCLRSVTYNNASQNPTTTGRTVNFVVNDGDSNSNTASKTVSVTAVNDPPSPTVNPVSYATAGNTQLHVEGKVLAGVVSVSDAQGVDAKAGPFTDPDGPVAPAIVNNDAGVSANGGSFDIDPDGSFTYVPPAGFTGTDSFTYQITDTVTPVNATVNIAVSEMIWYVHDVTGANNPAASDTGASNNAFEVLQDAINAAGPDDYVFVFRGNTGATPHAPATLTNKDGLKLHGQGFGLSVPGYPNLVPAGSEPNEAVIQNAAATGAEDNALQVTINTGTVDGVEIRGFEITATDNAIDVTVSGSATAGVTISHNSIGTTAMEGIDVNHGSTSTASAIAVHDNVLLTGGNAIDIARTNGTLKITAFDDNVVSGDTAGSGIVLTGAITFDSIPGTGALDAVSGGATMVGALGNPVTGSGITMSSITGSLTFTDLDIFAGGSGLVAAGTGAFTGLAGTSLQVTPASPDGIGTATIDADNGAGVDISNATIDLRLADMDSTTTGSGLSLNTVGGQFRAPSGSSILKSSGGGTAFSVASSSATVNYAGTLNVTSGSGVSLTGNSGATTFSGGMTLSTGANTAFSASGGGTVTVIDPAGLANNTITTTTGTALSISGTAIGASGATFESINSMTAGSNTVIVLANTGAGQFMVTGTSGAGTGGTISNKTADAMTLNNTDGLVTLKNMIIEDIGSTGGAFDTISTHDAIHGQQVDGGLTLEGVTIRRISDQAVHGATLAGNAATVWNGLTITNSTIENTNRFHVANVADDTNEGMVRILGIRGTVSITNSTLQDGGELIDFFVDGGTLNMTATNNNFFRAYKEFTSGPLASQGGHCVDVTVQGAGNANVTLGDRNNDALDNNFLNCRLGSVRVAADSTATGNIDVVIGRNDFTVNDHSSGTGGDFDFPQGGVAITSQPTTPDSVTFDVVIDGNYFDEITNASGGVGQLTLAMANGTWQVLVEDNTFDTPGNAPWFLRADSTSSAKVLFRNNVGIKGFFNCPDTSCGGGYNGPGLRSLADLQNGAVLDLTILNDVFAEHDASFDPGQTFEARVLNTGGGGTLCLDLQNNQAPDGYSLEEFAGDFNLVGSGTCPVGSPSPNCQTLLGNRGNRGGSNVATTNPPFVNVEVGATIDVVAGACQQPSGGIF